MRRFLSISLLLSTFLAGSIGSAQQASTTGVPNLIRYSGTLKDAQGAVPSEKTLGVTFAIYKQQDGGAPIWQETQNVTPEASGQYSVVLGGTTATGLPGDLFSQQEQRWLGVQVQGQTEQARVLLVAVPYAFEAVEAQRLAGHSATEFVTSDTLQSAVQQQLQQQPVVVTNFTAQPGTGTKALSQGPTNFTGATADQIVGVTQTGTGAGVSSSAPNEALVGTATAASGQSYGLYGIANGTGGIAVKGLANSPKGATNGVNGEVSSPAGIAGVFNNDAGGQILSGQNNGIEEFSVDGSGNVKAAGTFTGTSFTGSFTGSGAGLTGIPFSGLSGTLLPGQLSGAYPNALTLANGANIFTGSFTGSGAGLTGILFSQLGGILGSSQFSGSYGNAVTLSNAANTYYGNGSHLSGVVAGPGSPFYIQNGASLQSGANFNISGSGSANSFNSATTYQIGGSVVLGIGSAADQNVFLGVGAGVVNVAGTGKFNTFSGYQAGNSNTTGTSNTFSGYQAGKSNNTGISNTFSGYQAGKSNTSGKYNTFSGGSAGASNTMGSYNTFSSYGAGSSNTMGSYNTFSSYGAGSLNTTGNYNTYSGYAAGFFNTTGNNNTFYGVNAGLNNTSSNNTFVGYQAGLNNKTGSSDIYIGSEGPVSGTESNAIRIGDPSAQSTAYIAGVFGVTSPSGIAVYINSNGQLGTLTSSLRFKEQVRDMGDSTNALMKLRPVTFFYKPEYSKGERTLQYGLIAEEVAKVYPELVAYDSDGQPYTVRYQYLAIMLLNEVQKQYGRAQAEAKVITAQEQKIEELEQRLSRLEGLVRAQVQTVARERE